MVGLEVLRSNRRLQSDKRKEINNLPTNDYLGSQTGVLSKASSNLKIVESFLLMWNV